MHTNYAKKLVTISRAVALALPCPASTIGYSLGVSVSCSHARVSDIAITHALFSQVKLKSRNGVAYFAALSLNTDIRISASGITNELGNPVTSCYNSHDMDTIIDGYRFGRDGILNVNFIYDASSGLMKAASILRSRNDKDHQNRRYSLLFPGYE